MHALRVMATLGVGGNCAFLVETTSTNTLRYSLHICLRTPMLQLTNEQKSSENIAYVPGTVQLT